MVIPLSFTTHIVMTMVSHFALLMKDALLHFRFPNNNNGFVESQHRVVLCSHTEALLKRYEYIHQV